MAISRSQGDLLNKLQNRRVPYDEGTNTLPSLTLWHAESVHIAQPICKHPRTTHGGGLIFPNRATELPLSELVSYQLQQMKARRIKMQDRTCCTVRESTASARGPIFAAAALLTMGVSSLHSSLNRPPQSSCVVVASVAKRGQAVAKSPHTLTRFVNHSPFFSRCTQNPPIDDMQLCTNTADLEIYCTGLHNMLAQALSTSLIRSYCEPSAVLICVVFGDSVTSYAGMPALAKLRKQELPSLRRAQKGARDAHVRPRDVTSIRLVVVLLWCDIHASKQEVT